jgi:D-alanyl-D-alanine carboxypeptidase
MRIIEPIELKRRQAARLRHLHVRRGFIVLIILVFIAGYGCFAYQRPLPQGSAKASNNLAVTVASPSLAWPDGGQAAVGTLGQGVLAASSNQKPLPTASVAKVMTALAVLK